MEKNVNSFYKSKRKIEKALGGEISFFRIHKNEASFMIARGKRKHSYRWDLKLNRALSCSVV